MIIVGLEFIHPVENNNIHEFVWGRIREGGFFGGVGAFGS
jgi:hypothetical protein